jgi:hypothetical protein
MTSTALHLRVFSGHRRRATRHHMGHRRSGEAQSTILRPLAGTPLSVQSEGDAIPALKTSSLTCFQGRFILGVTLITLRPMAQITTPEETTPLITALGCRLKSILQGMTGDRLLSMDTRTTIEGPLLILDIRILAEEVLLLLLLLLQRFTLLLPDTLRLRL